jgi:Ku70/Ku80 beta-barrel domain
MIRSLVIGESAFPMVDQDQVNGNVIRTSGTRRDMDATHKTKLNAGRPQPFRGIVTTPTADGGRTCPLAPPRAEWVAATRRPAIESRCRRLTLSPATWSTPPKIVKGCKAGDGYIEITDEDLEAVEVDSTRIINADQFVPRTEIDDLYVDQPYYIVPRRQGWAAGVQRHP